MSSFDKREIEERIRSGERIPYPELTQNLSGYLENPDMERFDEEPPKKRGNEESNEE